MYQLFINDKEVDFEPSFCLIYRSSLLSDISKLESNNSYTIKLPLSSRNRRIFECSDIVTNTTRFPYLRHTAKVIKDSVTIIEGASVFLLASHKNSMEIALVWGAGRSMRNLKDKSLKDLSYTLDDYIVWSKGENSKLYPKINYGFVEDDTEVWYHPAVSVKWILDRISKDTKLKLNFPQDREQELNTMFIPLLERNDSELQTNLHALSLTPYKIAKDYGNMIYFRFLVPDKDSIYFYMKDDYTLKARDYKVKIALSGFLTFHAEANGNNGIPSSRPKSPVTLVITDKTNLDRDKKIYAQIPVEIIHIKDKIYKYVIPFDNVDIEMEPGEEISFILKDIYTLTENDYQLSVIHGESGYINLKGKYSPILGQRFYYVPNLPNIKQIDFIKAICSMLGLFAVTKTGPIIDFVPLDILKDKGRAIDMSNKLIDTVEGTLIDLKYQIDSMARNNYFLYNSDEKNIHSDGIISVDDDTLPYERKAVELPFAATTMYHGEAMIPLYTYKDNKAVLKDVTPRILRYNGTSGTFYGLEWGKLLEKYYSYYKALVNGAKIINVYITLNAIDLQLLDLTRPIYLSQYGSYFAIVNLKTKDDNVCEVELIKI